MVIFNSVIEPTSHGVGEKSFLKVWEDMTLSSSGLLLFYRTHILSKHQILVRNIIHLFWRNRIIQKYHFNGTRQKVQVSWGKGGNNHGKYSPRYGNNHSNVNDLNTSIIGLRLSSEFKETISHCIFFSKNMTPWKEENGFVQESIFVSVSGKLW